MDTAPTLGSIPAAGQCLGLISTACSCTHRCGPQLAICAGSRSDSLFRQARQLFLNLSKLACVVENSRVTQSQGVKLRLLQEVMIWEACLCMSSHEGLPENLGPFPFCWMSPLNKETLKNRLEKSWSIFATVKQHKLNHYKDLFYCHLSVFVSVSIPSF